MGLPERAKILERRLRQRHAPLPVALADDAQLQIGAVDGAYLQAHGFAYAQAAGVHEREAALVNRVPHAEKQRANLLVGENLGQPPLFGRANSFFSNSGQSRSSARR